MPIFAVSPVQTDPNFANYRYDVGGRRVVGRRSVAGLVTSGTAAQQGVGG